MFYLYLNIRRFFYHRSRHAVMFYVFLNIRRTKFCITRLSAFASGPSVHAGCQRVHAGYQRVHAGYQLVHAGYQRVHAGCQRLHAGCQRLHALCHAGCQFSPTSCCGLAFSTHCTDANRRETMPKQHYITCLAQCVPTLHPPSGFVSTPPSFYCRTLVGSLPLANNGQHSASNMLCGV